MKEKPEHPGPIRRDSNVALGVEAQLAALGPEKAVEMGVVTGREALEWLARNGDYVFHGTDRKLAHLEPRQQMQFNPKTGENIPDGEPAVCAARSIDPAIFMGVLRGHGAAGKGSHSGWGGSADRWRFYATADMLDSARHAEEPGYVYVFDAANFEHHRGDEWRSYADIEPVCVIPVAWRDMPEGVETADPAF